jgi:hypothetical protein
MEELLETNADEKTATVKLWCLYQSGAWKPEFLEAAKK